jgi:hypothetical protein
MAVRKDTDFTKFTKTLLVKEVKKWRDMYTASIKQTEKAQYLEIDLETYKGYLKDARERLTKVREERDLALRLLALRLSKFTT